MKTLPTLVSKVKIFSIYSIGEKLSWLQIWECVDIRCFFGFCFRYDLNEELVSATWGILEDVVIDRRLNSSLSFESISPMQTELQTELQLHKLFMKISTNPMLLNIHNLGTLWRYDTFWVPCGVVMIATFRRTCTLTCIINEDVVNISDE